MTDSGDEVERTPDRSALPPGSAVGKYRIVRRLGEGGMATIYLAGSAGPGGFTKQCALKVVRPEFMGRESISRMLATEARVAAALNHPHIVQVFDFGRLGSSYFMAMEWVDGVSLGHVMSRMMRERRRISVPMIAHVVAAVAEALAYLQEGVDVDGHTLPLVHRDVSPSNILLSSGGMVKLSDFGVVKILDQSSETKTGVVKGKYAYMAPEQLRGEPVDHRADQFSLGVVLFEMLTMARLFQRRTTAGTIAAVHAARVPPPSSLWPDIPPALDALVLRMLARKREDRFAESAEVVAALQPFLGPSGRSELMAEVRAMSTSESTRPSLAPMTPQSLIEDLLPAVGADEFDQLEIIEGEDADTAASGRAVRPEPWAVDDGDALRAKTMTPTGGEPLTALARVAAAAERPPALRYVVLTAAALLLLAVGAAATYAVMRSLERAEVVVSAPAAPTPAGPGSAPMMAPESPRAAEASLPATSRPQPAEAAPPQAVEAAAAAPSSPPARVDARVAARAPRPAATPERRPSAAAARRPLGAPGSPSGSAAGDGPGLASADDIERSSPRKPGGTAVDGVLLADEDDVDKSHRLAAPPQPQAATVGDAVIAEDYD